jgi:hypothetical protein
MAVTCSAVSRSSTHLAEGKVERASDADEVTHGLFGERHISHLAVIQKDLAVALQEEMKHGGSERLKRRVNVVASLE